MFEEIKVAHAAYVAALAESDLSRFTAAELVELTRLHEDTRRRMVGFDHVLVTELVDRNVAGEFGFASTKALLNQALRITPTESGHRVHAAAVFGPRRGLTGEALEPVYPLMAQAMADGCVSREHADVLVSTIRKLPV